MGQLERAIQDYDETVRLDPQCADAYVNRGGAYVILGQPEKAIQDLDEAIGLDPKIANAYALRAFTYTSLGKDIEAQRDVDRAVELGLDRGTLDDLIEELKNQR